MMFLFVLMRKRERLKCSSTLYYFSNNYFLKEYLEAYLIFFGKGIENINTQIQHKPVLNFKDKLLSEDVPFLW